MVLVKKLPANAGDIRDTGFDPEWEDPSGNVNPLRKYSYLENPMGEAWWATVHRKQLNMTKVT